MWNLLVDSEKTKPSTNIKKKCIDYSTNCNVHEIEFLSLNGDCTGLSESTLLKTPHCWKSHAAAHSVNIFFTKKQDNLGQELQCTLKVKEDFS